MKREKPVIGFIIGDGSGVGPELTAKLAAQGVLEEEARPVVFGDVRLWQKALRETGSCVKWRQFQDMDQVSWDQGLPVIHVGEQNPDEIVAGRINEICGNACIEMIKYASVLYMKGKIHGICYAPLNKAAMKLAHSPAASEMELFALLLGRDRGFGEINMLDGVWTTRVTSHIPIKDISRNLTKEAVLDSIRLAHATVKSAGIEEPRIGVCALNPHAGEGGLCGDEEIRVIAPAVNEAQKEKIGAQGPFPADTLFKQAFDGRFHAVVTMYHDQGQIALKLRGFERGITICGGLNMPAATCAHGTAHDIAWKGTASSQSLEHAYRMVCRMAQNGTAASPGP
ncbi:4-hydroxythreonine-4-phosphate dehydrogenase PdxA [Clostridium sp. MCC353]|uniref:PdxA family dehydrogenase n=1 Tax=Clostridium sp. MCC353 TaxID=2592646 RepID=UPI001C01DF67|nr:4-hydroxythreonine-4-phosphate dehydrogenase PdxA [Clostridium sp. MCC353]MBT9778712.1 4-hydroxythreonine-4-phosphate dehydrogenase PdxA [Clostridium sp. MCC353]